MYKLKEQIIENDEYHQTHLPEDITYYVLGLDKERYKVQATYAPHSLLAKTIDEISSIDGVDTIRLYESVFKYHNEFKVHQEPLV